MTNDVMLLEFHGGYRAVGWGRVWTKRLDRPRIFRFGFPRDSSNKTYDQSYKNAESGADLNEQCSSNSTVCDLRHCDTRTSSYMNLTNFICDNY